MSATTFFRDNHISFETIADDAALQRRTKEQEESLAIDRKDLDTQLDTVHALANKTRHTRLKREMLTRRLRLTLQSNPELANNDLTYVSGRLLIVVGSLVVAFVLDYILFKSAVIYLVSLIGIDASSGFAFIATLLVPLMVISLEMVLASCLYYAWEKKSRSVAGYVSALVYTAICAAITIVMPVISAATFMANEGVSSIFALDLPMRLLLLGLLVLSFSTHAVIVFSGKYANEGKALALVHARKFRVERLLLKEARQEDATYTAFRKYERSVEASNEKYPDSSPVKLGPFDEKTRALINGRAGSEVIPVLSGSIGKQPPAR